MIVLGTQLTVADNSGAKVVECINVHGGATVRWAEVGETITVAVKSAVPHAKVSKSQIHNAVIVRTKQNIKRSDGTDVSFNSNSVVLIDKKNEPIGSRIFGPIAREVRNGGYLKIASLAPEVL
ncbi:MAG: large subunit ribosomal protein L14 [Candidatus Deianiraeaceae bacterium]|jgi:large subunit ribosomal protein L14